MTLLQWPDYRLFEYEYGLARREVDALLPGLPARKSDIGLVVGGPVGDEAADRMTYVGRVTDGARVRVPLQARVEEVHRLVTGRRGGKQATRFLVHDLHEYKGKFNPQIARALINIFGTDADLVIDPYSGSGTTAVEALRLGKATLGLDMNPLAAWMTSVKARVVAHEDPAALAREFEDLSTAVRGLVATSPVADLDSGASGFDGLWSQPSMDYLQRWFPASTLGPMARALALILGRGDVAADLLRLAISSISRQVSWQLPEDLRIRRRPSSWQPPNYGEVLEPALQRVARALTECAKVGHHARGGVLTAAAGDARSLHEIAAATIAGRKAIITSPPYATALPYIDTDRLSLVALGLAQPSQVRKLEGELTGSREWGPREARAWASRMETNSDALPHDVLEVCSAVAAKNAAEGGGFRRQAVPALLYRYFTHMSEALRSWAKVLQPGEHAVLVIGSNRTGGRSNPIVVDTPSLTAACGEAEGFMCVEKIPFQVWARYGLHSKNGVSGESAVVLRRT